MSRWDLGVPPRPPSPHPILGYSLPCALIAQLAQHLMLHYFFSLIKTKYGLICSSIDDIAMSYLFLSYHKESVYVIVRCVPAVMGCIALRQISKVEISNVRCRLGTHRCSARELDR